MEKGNAKNSSDRKFETADEKLIVDVGRLSGNEIPSTDEVRTIIQRFLNKFACQYPEPGPLLVSFIGPLNEALNHSLFEPTTPRPLILYLHHSRSVAVNIFYQYVLCEEAVTTYLAEEFLIWTWDRTQETDYFTLLTMLSMYTTKEVAKTVASFPIDAYPLLVCLSVHQNQIDVVSVIQGTMSNAETLAKLLESRKKFDRRAELLHSKLVNTNLVSNENQSTLEHILKPLIKRSSTIESITKEFENSSKQIVRIEQVENATRLPQYLEQKKIMDTQPGHDQNEQFLFHGCSRWAAEQIIQDGFDHKLIGMHGTAYGYGFYFSSDHRISDQYAILDHLNSDERTMLICRVLVGRMCRANRNMRECPTGYDSTTDGSKIYVVYSNKQILPEYVITYKEKDNIYEDELFAYRKKASNATFCNLS